MTIIDRGYFKYREELIPQVKNDTFKALKNYLSHFEVGYRVYNMDTKQIWEVKQEGKLVLYK